MPIKIEPISDEGMTDLKKFITSAKDDTPIGRQIILFSVVSKIHETCLMAGNPIATAEFAFTTIDTVE